MIISVGVHNRHKWFVGIIKKFQGIGFVISTDEPIIYHDLITVELRFLFLKAWYIYELKKNKL